MAQIFHRSTNTIARLSIYGAVILIALLGFAVDVVNKTSYVTEVNNARPQPVPFSHKHHVGELGLDCRYCHTSVEVASSAGMPPTETCMTCHSQVWRESPMLAPVRVSYNNNTPLHWNRVHDLPNYVYFDHSIHVSKGVGCSECHGRVDLMPLTWKTASLEMQWCLNCHRDPGKHLRPHSEIFNMDWKPTESQNQLGKELVQKNQIEVWRLDNCSVCHR